MEIVLKLKIMIDQTVSVFILFEAFNMRLDTLNGHWKQLGKKYYNEAIKCNRKLLTETINSIKAQRKEVRDGDILDLYDELSIFFYNMAIKLEEMEHDEVNEFIEYINEFKPSVKISDKQLKLEL